MESQPRLLDQMREVLRLKHLSYRTEESYVSWVKRFIPTTLLNEVSRAGAFSCVRDRPGADAVACLPRTVAPHPHGRL